MDRRSLSPSTDRSPPLSPPRSSSRSASPCSRATSGREIVPSRAAPSRPPSASRVASSWPPTSSSRARATSTSRRVPPPGSPRSASPRSTSARRARRDALAEPRREHPLTRTSDDARLDERAWRAAWRAAAAAAGVRSSGRRLRRIRAAGGDRRPRAHGPRHRAARPPTSSSLRVRATPSRCWPSDWPSCTGRESTVVVEEPGYPSSRDILRRMGATIVPVAVDADGIDLAALARVRHADAVLVTPSHHYPLGGRLPVSRRLELMHWAREQDASRDRGRLRQRIPPYRPTPAGRRHSRRRRTGRARRQLQQGADPVAPRSATSFFRADRNCGRRFSECATS